MGALGVAVSASLTADPSAVRGLFPSGTRAAIARAMTVWEEEQQRDTVAHLLPTRLAEAEVPFAMMRRVIRHLRGGDAAAVVTLRDLYCLLDVPRIGWQTADAIAQGLGVSQDALAQCLARDNPLALSVVALAAIGSLNATAIEL